MFDTILCDRRMPDGFKSESYQSKDLACELAVYRITDHDRLVREKSTGDDWHQVEHDPPEAIEYHGWLCFYETDGDDNWHEYHAKFTDGKLVEIRCAASKLDTESGHSK